MMTDRKAGTKPESMHSQSAGTSDLTLALEPKRGNATTQASWKVFGGCLIGLGALFLSAGIGLGFGVFVDQAVAAGFIYLGKICMPGLSTKNSSGRHAVAQVARFLLGLYLIPGGVINLFKAALTGPVFFLVLLAASLLLYSGMIAYVRGGRLVGGEG